MVHFFGLYSSEYGKVNKLRLNDEGYLALKNHPLRLKFKPFKDLIQLDTLETLIEDNKKVANIVYKILADAENQDRDFNEMARRINKLDDLLVDLNQAFELFVAQYKMRKKDTKPSPELDLLWQEIVFHIDPHEDKGHHKMI